MIRGIYIAARGMAVQHRKQEVITANLANVNTTGFKKDITLAQSFPEMMTFRMEKGSKTFIGKSSKGVFLSEIVTSHLPGVLEETGHTLDLAITGRSLFEIETEEGLEQREGTAFFAVATPQGVRYTRDGSFSLDRDGFLVDSNGYHVLSIDNQPIQLESENIQISDEGVIRIGQEQEHRAQLLLAVFDNEDLAGLQKRGQNLFEAVDAEPVGEVLGQVRQGALESANLNIITEMVNMIKIMRIYEANQKALQAHDDLLGKSVNEVGNLR